MANETIVTLRGWAGAKPTIYTNTVTNEGEIIKRNATVLRLGVTPSYFNRRTDAFEHGQTVWYSVRSYGALAENVAQSVESGTPLLVRGRLTQKFYTDKTGVERTDLVVLADTIAVDLNTGVTRWQKINRAALDSVDGEGYSVGRSATDYRNSDDVADNDASAAASVPDHAGNLAKVAAL